MAEALDYALGPPVVVVAKRRHLFLWEGVRIHLDEVEELGTFIEFEAVLESPAGDEAIALAHEKLRAPALRAGDRGRPTSSRAATPTCCSTAREALMRAAEAARRNAYAPYSNFKVGAAVRAPSGAVYVGANVENAAYPQGQCAEASALGALVAAGESAITAVAVVADRRRALPALRRLPAAAIGVRRARDAGVPRSARDRARRR